MDNCSLVFKKAIVNGRPVIVLFVNDDPHSAHSVSGMRSLRQVVGRALEWMESDNPAETVSDVMISAEQMQRNMDAHKAEINDIINTTTH